MTMSAESIFVPIYFIFIYTNISHANAMSQNKHTTQILTHCRLPDRKSSEYIHNICIIL